MWRILVYWMFWTLPVMSEIGIFIIRGRTCLKQIGRKLVNIEGINGKSKYDLMTKYL